eukprot:1916226-Pyramimonas_sp.AAC.1
MADVMFCHFDEPFSPGLRVPGMQSNVSMRHAFTTGFAGVFARAAAIKVRSTTSATWPSSGG